MLLKALLGNCLEVSLNGSGRSRAQGVSKIFGAGRKDLNNRVMIRECEKDMEKNSEPKLFCWKCRAELDAEFNPEIEEYWGTVPV